MTALANWNPQPIMAQPVFAPLKRHYQLARLHEQLQLATNGGRNNIFQVSGFGSQRLPDNHASSGMGGLMSAGMVGTPMMVDGEDAPGEPDFGAFGFPVSARSASFGPAGGSDSRRQSVASRA